jgi:PAS domain-containing protein
VGGHVYSLDLRQGSRYRNATGDPVRVMGTVMDITARKRDEEELKGCQRIA